MQDSAAVAHSLAEIAGFLRFAGAQRFKVNAYEHAARVVRTLDEELAPLVECRERSSWLSFLPTFELST